MILTHYAPFRRPAGAAQLANSFRNGAAHPLLIISQTRMKRFLLPMIVAIGAGIDASAAAPALAIEPAVQITFDTRPSLYYQLESASSNGIPMLWIPVGSPLRGFGKPQSQTVLTSAAWHQFFRTQEYDLTNNLIAHYPLDGNGAELTGFSANSSQSRGYGTNRFGIPNRAGLLWAIGTSGPYSLPISVGGNGSRIGTNDLTISFWFSNPGFTWSYPGLFALSGPREIRVISEDYSTLKVIGTSNTVSFVSRPLEWVPGRWHHIQLVCQNNVNKLYRDGVFLGQGLATPPNGLASSWTLGVGPGYGSADEIRVFSRALSEEELSILFRLED